MPAGWIWQTSHLQNFSQRKGEEAFFARKQTLAGSCLAMSSFARLTPWQRLKLALKQIWILDIMGERAERVQYIEEFCSFLQHMTACFEEQPNSFLHVCSVTLPHTSDPHVGSLCPRSASSEFFLGDTLKSHYWPRVRGIKMEKHTAGVWPQLTAGRRRFWLKKKEKEPHGKSSVKSSNNHFMFWWCI